MTIKIGPAGTGGDSYKGLQMIKEAGLDAVEIEFVRGVKMSNETAKKIGELNKKLGLILSIHAPYYINLNSEEKPKIEASKQRILQSCERGHHLGARCIVFHASYYGKSTPEECYDATKEAIIGMQKKIKENEWDVILCPETTGKGSQFGTVDELVKLSRETGCGICVDFAHVYARNNGRIDYDDVMGKIKRIKHLTAHFSGINFTAKGERNHELTPPERIRELYKYLKKYNISITIINESPDPMGDALKMKRMLKEV
ncbi:endonuclease IV [Candidatus Woesearchaeota archaeon CG10_big_fil_rev_8_21_14_0_10_44_13]|nr:MAG: endonuclease IV [Candidatus Woesearchaeota archaeon CG10_big_fil_rev_8_21_14_0_10_44_13]